MPDDAPEEGEHEHVPEHVTDASDGLCPNLPAGQSVHALAAAAFEYFPTSHEMHAADDEAPLAAEYVPARHSMHEALPVDDLYLPATHAWQPPPFGPV